MQQKAHYWAVKKRNSGVEGTVNNIFLFVYPFRKVKASPLAPKIGHLGWFSPNILVFMDLNLICHGLFPLSESRRGAECAQIFSTCQTHHWVNRKPAMFGRRPRSEMGTFILKVRGHFSPKCKRATLLLMYEGTSFADVRGHLFSRWSINTI